MNDTCPSKTNGHYSHFKRPQTKSRLMPFSSIFLIKSLLKDKVQVLLMTCENNCPLFDHYIAPTGPPWALRWDSCSACTTVWSRVKVALRMNKLSRQMIQTQQIHVHRFKGERAETKFLQHRVSVRKIRSSYAHSDKVLWCVAYKKQACYAI